METSLNRMGESKNLKTVAIPLPLWKEVGRMIHHEGGYFNEAEYVREAVRWKLALDRATLEGRVEAFRLRYRGRPSSKDEESSP